MSIRGTTPVFSLDLEGVDLGECTVIVTIDQNGTQVIKSGDNLIIEPLVQDDEIIGQTVNVFLSQEDTLEFDVGQADVQVRWIDGSDNAFASEIGTVRFDRVLLEEVIKYGD